jgi:DNA-directed RNA polymerase subunit RPC12/RpoP
MPPPGQQALDAWHLEIVCPKCDHRTQETVRLLATVDAIFCKNCWSRIDLGPLKPGIAADEQAAIDMSGRMRPEPDRSEPAPAKRR